MNFFLLICFLFFIFLQGCNNQRSSVKEDEFNSYVNDNTQQETPEKNTLMNVKF